MGAVTGRWECTEGNSGSSWYAEVEHCYQRGGDGRGDLALRETTDRFSDSPDCHSKIRRTQLRVREAIIHTGSMKAQRDASEALFQSETFPFFLSSRSALLDFALKAERWIFMNEKRKAARSKRGEEKSAEGRRSRKNMPLGWKNQRCGE